MFLVLLVLLSGTLACQNSTGTEPDSETEPEEIEVTEEQAIETFADFLEESGLISDSVLSKEPVIYVGSINITDYISWDDNESGTPALKLWIGPEGHIIPNAEWREANEDACKSEFRYMKAGVHLLNIKIHTNSREVTIQYIDVETGVIEKQQMGQGEGQSWLYDAIENAWNKFDNLNIKPAEGACGDQFKLSISFRSEITTVYPDVTFFDHVESELGLTWHEEDSQYEGTGTLKSVESYTTLEGTCNRPDAEFNVLSLTLNDSDDIELIIQFDSFEFGVCGGEGPIVPIFPFAWAALHLEEAELLAEPLEYTLTGWKMDAEDSGVIAQKDYDRSFTTESDEDGESVTYTEKTMIQVIRE